MKRILFVFTFMFAAALARAQLVTIGSITTSTGTVVTSVATTLYSGLMVSIHGTYGSFTANFEVSDDNGTTWYSVMCTRQDLLTTQEISEAVSPDNSSRAWTCPLGGANLFRVRASALASGTVSLRITQSNQVSAKGGGGAGGGSGTVSANNTAAGAVANYAAAGGSTTVQATTLNYVAPTLTVSTAAGGNGVLALSGNTSGTATLTAPAVAVTTTNAIVSTNNIAGPAQANCTNGGTFNAGGTAGLSFPGGANVASICQASLENVRFNGAAIQFGTNTVAFGSAVNTNDVGVSRSGAGMLAIGNGTSGNETGLARSANSCAISADIALTVNVVTNICQFPLPAVAKVWIVSCDLPWTITAGTGTNTMSIGVNASQTPTATTNLTGLVYNATATAPTYLATALSASGALNIVTGASYVPTATIQSSSLHGTVAASGTAGTFTVTMTAAGTTATAATKSGAECRLE